MNERTPEERLAEVLERHEEFRWLNDGPGDGVVCDCGHVIPERDSGYVVDWHRDHLAAAILAHLTAEGWAQGREEWGVTSKWGTAERSSKESAESTIALHRKHDDWAKLMRRHAMVTDWEPVDG